MAQQHQQRLYVQPREGQSLSEEELASLFGEKLPEADCAGEDPITLVGPAQDEISEGQWASARLLRAEGKIQASGARNATVFPPGS